MAGNVWEIVNDKFDEDYYQRLSLKVPSIDPQGSSRSFYSSNELFKNMLDSI